MPRKSYDRESRYAAPMIRDCVTLFVKRHRGRGIRIGFLFASTRRIALYDVGKTVLPILVRLGGARSVDEIARDLSCSSESVAAIVDYFVDEGVVDTHRGPARTGRFSRQLRFFDSFVSANNLVDEMQDKLRFSHVVLLGCGGIGSCVAEGLARIGVGKLTLIDADIVESENLPAQSLVRESDIGRYKVDAMSAHLSSINPKMEVLIERKRINTSGEFKLYLPQTSLVINAADSPSVDKTNSLVTEACFDFGVPHILCGGYDGHLSFIGPTVIPRRSACWRCYAHHKDVTVRKSGLEHIDIGRTAEAGAAFTSLACIAGQLHVSEALKVITGCARAAMLGTVAEFDFLTFRLTKTRFARRKNCPRCSK